MPDHPQRHYITTRLATLFICLLVTAAVTQGASRHILAVLIDWDGVSDLSRQQEDAAITFFVLGALAWMMAIIAYLLALHEIINRTCNVSGIKIVEIGKTIQIYIALFFIFTETITLINLNIIPRASSYSLMLNILMTAINQFSFVTVIEYVLIPAIRKILR